MLGSKLLAIAGILVALGTLCCPGQAYAVCEASVINPISDVCWQCIFPVRMGGITLISSDVDSPADNIGSNPLCICGTTLGMKVSFWEPARIIETVKDPYCFNLIGAQIGDGGAGWLGGGYRQENVGKNTFAQAHYYLFNVWSILDLFMDLPCLETGGFDIAYLTEVDPLWNDDLLGFILNPEALLFANPVAQLACMADSASSAIGLPLSPLFWCMGSWGSAYPLTGHRNDDNFVQANAAIAARMIYKLSRELALWDTASDACGAIMMPIWVKEHYRMQVMKPMKDFTCHPIGRTSLIWGSMKNPPGGGGSNAADNFDWALFRKILCCVGYSF